MKTSPVYSMTGYASLQSVTQASTSGGAETSTRIGLEIRSVNSRFLDIGFKIGEELRHTEPALREQLTAALKRGKVELRVFVAQTDASALKTPPAAWMAQLAQVQAAVRAALPSARELGVGDILRMASNETTGADRAGDYALACAALCKDAIEALKDSRAREGARLAQTLVDRLHALRALAQQAAPLVPLLVEQQRKKFLDRWREAMALGDGVATPEAAQDRALTEATSFAIRIDVAEELNRLAVHLDEIERLLQLGGELGKRLDFLIQELHREANTLGSKSTTMELTRISVDMKVLIEQMREQVQNIE
jgi:uncharacterized protein (TIGR00255 family)